MKKSLPLLIVLAMMAVFAFSGCKNDEAEKIITITGIDSKYNGLTMELSLYKVKFSDLISPEATASAKVSGGTAKFVLLEENGNLFTGTGFYYPVITIFDANGLDYGMGAGTTTIPVFISRETTTLKFGDFTFKGI